MRRARPRYLANVILHSAIVAAAAFALVRPTVALAADLYPNGAHNGAKPYAASPYDDPRYADLYGPEKSYPAGKHRKYDDDDRYYGRDGGYAHKAPYDNGADDRYDDYGPYAGKYERGPVFDRRLDYPRRRWHRRDYARADHCVPRRVIIWRLLRGGWFGFHGLEFRGRKVSVAAANRDGGHYRLIIARCSGEIIKARRLDYAGSYGYNGGRTYGMYRERRAPPPYQPYK